MADLPRLAVTREQADEMVCVPKNNHYYSADEWVLPESFTLRLPERPTMPPGPKSKTRRTSVPIPEGTRVEVGWWDVPDDRTEPMDWYPVATATVGEVLAPLYDDDFWIVVLTDVEVTDG